MPVWQFNEVHARRIAAPPEKVYEAIEQVRADEILFFRMLTWIRRGGRRLPQGILNAGIDRPLLEVATSTTFRYLADDPPHETVVGTCIAPGTTGAMNFLVQPDGDGSLVTTETRVFADNPRARRRFALYWSVIYPGSALIRRMWLRAIALRCESPSR